jgi:hypothetical protein
MTVSPSIEYFGRDTVQRAIAAYFAKHGITEDVRDYLMVLEDEKPDDFFQMVCDFIEK